jgi:hypothetical protein
MIREVNKGRLKFEGRVKPLEATDRSNGVLRAGDICLVEDEKAFPLTSERFGKKDVLDINEALFK